MVNNEVIQSSIFDPMVKYLVHVSGIGDVTMHLPEGEVSLDTEKVLQYFEEDVSLNFERGRRYCILQGRLKDLDLANYLMQKMANRMPKWSNLPDSEELTVKELQS